MNVIIRTDASHVLGSGHVMRCLSLADSLKRRGWNVSFLSRETPGHEFSLIGKRGFRLYILGQDDRTQPDFNHPAKDGEKSEKFDWLIVDHYELDSRWETCARNYAKKIMVIDDFTHRSHDCDLLLNQNYYENPELLYRDLLPASCRKLIGPDFALLHPAFGEFRKNLRRRQGQIKRVLVFFGSSDATGETKKALKAIASLKDTGIHWDVVVGENNKEKAAIEELCQKIPLATFHCQTDRMPQLMRAADLALGAGGSTTWERCCMGLPSLLISTVSNQDHIAKSADIRKFGVYLGPAGEVTPQAIKNQLEKLLKEPETILKFSESAANLVDGRGAERVGEILSQ